VLSQLDKAKEDRQFSAQEVSLMKELKSKLLGLAAHRDINSKTAIQINLDKKRGRKY
jgi:hypothetical protein